MQATVVIVAYCGGFLSPPQSVGLSEEEKKKRVEKIMGDGKIK